MAEPSKSDEQEPPKEVDKTNEGRRRADDEPAKGARENVTKNKEEEPAGVSSSKRIEKGIKNDKRPISLRLPSIWLVSRMGGKKYNLHHEKEMKYDHEEQDLQELTTAPAYREEGVNLGR
ncbi:hypothetical protein Tco_0127863 [Tanacetum coccineum]